MLARLARRIGGAAMAALIAGVAGAAEQPVSGGQLTAVLPADPPLLVSAFDTTQATGQVSGKLLEGLIRLDAELNPQPVLAQRWSQSADGRVLTFHLRRGVKWHDGVEFTSADVGFSAMKVWRYGPRRAAFAGLSEVDLPDAQTVIFRLQQPFAGFLVALTGYEAPVLPQHLYDNGEPVANPRNNAPVGTGPFRFKEWRRGSEIRLERNPDYWQAGRPYLDQLVFRTIADAGERARGFETGELLYGGFNPVALGEAERLDKLPHLDLESRGYAGLAPMHILAFNLAQRLTADRHVRRAIAHAVDRAALVRSVWLGFGTPADAPLPAGARFHAADLPSYAYDPRRAEALLDEAGYPRKADGKRFKLTLDFAPYGADHQRSAELVRQQLGRVGIEAEVRTQELAQWRKRIQVEHQFELATDRLFLLADPALVLARLYRSGGFTGYANPELDQLLDLAGGSLERRRRAELYARAQRIMMEDLPILPLFEARYFTLFNRRVQDHATPDGPFGNFAGAWLAR